MFVGETLSHVGCTPSHHRPRMCDRSSRGGSGGRVQRDSVVVRFANVASATKLCSDISLKRKAPNRNALDLYE